MPNPPSPATRLQNHTFEFTLTALPGRLPATTSYLEELLWTLVGMEGLEEVYHPESDDQTRADHLTSIKIFSRDPGFADRLADLLASDTTLQAAGCRILDIRTLKEEDWAESWKQHWKPTSIHERLTICPSWETYALQQADEIVLKLDPGAAFGTGTHETTRLMLQGLYTLSQERAFDQLSVLDVGTGSGILGIYAARLGCRTVTGVDNDPQAVHAAQENAMLNGVAASCTFSDIPLEDLCRTPHDLVLANIIAPVILELLPEMLARLSPNGCLLLSGLIEKSVSEVENALAKAGVQNIQRHRLGDWFLLKGNQPAAQ